MATVEESYLDKLKDAIKTNQVTAKARAAGNWFRSVVNRTKGAFSSETPQKILSRQESTVANALLGRMYFYSYNPNLFILYIGFTNKTNRIILLLKLRKR